MGRFWNPQSSGTLRISPNVCWVSLSLDADSTKYEIWKEKFVRYERQNLKDHHHVHEGLGLIPVPWSLKWNLSLHLFFGLPMFLRPFGLYCSACFGILFVSILCTCCSHFFWYCFISFTMFCAPVFSLIDWFFLYPVLLSIVSVSKISSVLLLNVVPLFSPVPKLHFQISMLL